MHHFILCVAVVLFIAAPFVSAHFNRYYGGDLYGGNGYYGGGGYGGFNGYGGYPRFGGSSSSNALGGGQIGYGDINSDNTAFSSGNTGFAHGNTNARGYGANIFSAASSNSYGWRR